MSTLPAHQHQQTGQAVAEPPAQEARFTVEQFHQICETGIFEDRKVELIDGRIIVSPIPGEDHFYTVNRVRQWAEQVFDSGSYWVRQEGGFQQGQDTELGPDVAVIEGSMESAFRRGRPRQAVLIVEVARTSQVRDHGEKMRKYAESGTPEYWVIDLVARNISVYRRPQRDPSAPGTYSYAERAILGEEAVVSPITRPAGRLVLREVLP